MKTTLLSSLFLSSLCLSLTAFSASEPKRKPAESPAQKSKMEEAWDHIEDAGADLRDGVSGAVNDFIGFSRDAIHERPDLDRKSTRLNSSH